MTDATRRITKFDFSGEDAHVALVDAAANEQEVLVMKSKEAPLSEDIILTPEENTMSTETVVEKSLEEVIASVEDANLSLDITEQIAKARAQGQLEAQAEIKKAKEDAATLVEAANAKVEAIQKGADVELLKGFVRKSIKLAPFNTGMTEKAFAKSLMAVHALGKDGQAVIACLEKAAAMHIDTLSFEELGVTLVEEEQVTGLQKAMKAQVK
jgi:hypothetical protein